MAGKKKQIDFLNIIKVAGKKNRRPVPATPAEAEARRKASERCKNDPRFKVNLGAGNEFANNQPGDYENGVKVRNKRGLNQFTASRGLKFYNASEVKKFLDHEAPPEFCEKAGLPSDNKHTIGDCFLWANAREMLLSADPYRRDRATDLILRLAAVAQESKEQHSAQSNVGVLNAPRITNIHFVDSPKDKREAEQKALVSGPTIDVKES